jgi:transposase-like protein
MGGKRFTNDEIAFLKAFAPLWRLQAIAHDMCRDPESIRGACLRYGITRSWLKWADGSPTQKLPIEQQQQIVVLARRGATQTALAKQFGVSPGTIRNTIQRSRDRQWRRRDYEPTPEEIAALCEEFRRIAPRPPVGFRKYRIPTIKRRKRR